MGKRRSRRRIPSRNDDKATHVLRQVFPAFVVDDINEALLTKDGGSVFIARCGKDSMMDFLWRRSSVWSTTEIVKFINKCDESNFVICINNAVSCVNYEIRFNVFVTFKEKSRIIGTLNGVIKSMESCPEKSKLIAEVRRIKQGGVLILNDPAKARRDGHYVVKKDEKQKSDTSSS